MREEQKKKTYFFFIPSASNFSELKLLKAESKTKETFFFFIKTHLARTIIANFFVYLLPPCGSMSTAYW